MDLRKHAQYTLLTLEVYQNFSIRTIPFSETKSKYLVPLAVNGTWYMSGFLTTRLAVFLRGCSMKLSVPEFDVPNGQRWIARRC